MMSRVSLTRRSFIVAGGLGVLGAGGAAAAMEYDVLPGRTRAYDLLGLNGTPGRIPAVEPGETFRGELFGARWVICRPPVSTVGLPVVIALHGAGGSAMDLVEGLGIDRFLAASGEQFVIAAIDGGTSYWHDRADGSDTGTLVLEKFLPVLESYGLDVTRPGFLGWSMGGYGALLLGSTLGTASGPVCAVSPALWPTYLEAQEHAFDGEADFAEHNLFEQRDTFAGLDVRVDCGRGDPFFHNAADFVAGTDIEFHADRGGHDAGYWARVLPAQLAWLGARLG